MRFYILLFSTVLLIGCGGAEVVNKTANTNAANALNANVVKTNVNNPLATTTPPPSATTNDAPTVAPVVAAYYEALKKKDDAALRKILAQRTLKSLEADMKSENEKSLAKFITDLEPAPDKPFEVRNEIVTGDSIIAEMRGDSYPNGIKIIFIKENGEWKMTNESPDFKPSGNPISNSAK